MGFLASEIRHQKWLEKEVETSAFLNANRISENALIYEMEFDKKAFKSEKEVREYLYGKGLSTDKIEETESGFTAHTLNWSQVDMTTAISVEVRRGVTAKAADLILWPMDNYNFSEKGVVFFGAKLQTVELSEETKDLPQVIEIARVVEGEHPTYGKISITKEHLKSFVTNFEAKVTGTDLAINEDHKKNEAFGWYKDIFLSEDESILYGTVSWNAKGTRALGEKEYRYFSPEFRFNYTHPHTGKEHGPTLLGGALTNYPFLKMDAITELNEKSTNKGNAMPTIDLAEHDKVVTNLNAKNVELSTKLDASNAQVLELSNKVKAMEETAEAEKKKSAHQKLFDAGKINAAQLVALNEGKTMLEVIALNEPMNLKPAGKGTDKDIVIELSEADKALAKKLGLTDEEYIAGNK